MPGLQRRRVERPIRAARPLRLQRLRRLQHNRPRLHRSRWRDAGPQAPRLRRRFRSELMPALLYALGGGWGHLTRAVALARASLARGITLRVLTNSPYAPRIASAIPDLCLITLPPDLPAAQARQETLRVIRDAAPDCLIVDTFPRGLGGELATTIEKLAPKRVLIHRDLNPRYVSSMNLHDFVRCHYDLILIPGEDEGRAFADHPAASITAPWLISASGNPAAPDDILVCAAGDARELPWYGKVASLLRARCIAPVCPPGCPPELWIDHW